MAKKTYKFWAVSPQDPSDRKLMAEFEVDGKKVEANVKDSMIQERVDEGFHTDDGQLTMESDGPAFVELLAANYATSSFVRVEIA